jgi:hypothetical protein
MNNTSFKVKHNTLNYKVLLFLFDTSKKYNFFLQEKRVKSIIGVLLSMLENLVNQWYKTEKKNTILEVCCVVKKNSLP